MRTRTRRATITKTAAAADGPTPLAEAAADGAQVKVLEDLRVEEVSVVTAGANLRPFLVVKSSAGLVGVQKTLAQIAGITEASDKLGALGAVITLIANAERPSEVQAILDALGPVVEKVGNLAGTNEASASSEIDEMLGLDHLDARIAMLETKLAGMRQRRAKAAEIEEAEQRLRSLRLAKSAIVAKMSPAVSQAMQLMQQAMQLLQQASGSGDDAMTPEQAAAAAAAQAQLAATPRTAAAEPAVTPPTAQQATEAAVATEAAAPVAKAAVRPAAPASRPEDLSAEQVAKVALRPAHKQRSPLPWLL